jgi:hypothetical protein
VPYGPLSSASPRSPTHPPRSPAHLPRCPAYPPRCIVLPRHCRCYCRRCVVSSSSSHRVVVGHVALLLWSRVVLWLRWRRGRGRVVSCHIVVMVASPCIVIEAASRSVVAIAASPTTVIVVVVASSEASVYMYPGCVRMGAGSCK